MGFKLYNATVILNDGAEEAVQYWSNSAANSKNNIIDAGSTYLKEHPMYKGKLMVKSAKRVPYNMMEEKNEENS